MLRRAALAATVAALLAAAPLAAVPAFASTARVAATSSPAEDVTAPPKVVIVVGAVGTVTSTFRSDADAMATEALKYTSNVVKIYSPNATWSAVQAAAQGASIFIYLGHGYGFPSPYQPVLTPSVQDGLGLNAAANSGDDNTKYYGESVVGPAIRFAPNALVILAHACYSSGTGEEGMAEPTIPVAKERVDNFASGFLKAGARAVMADAYNGNGVSMIDKVFTTHQTVLSAWHQLYGGSGDITWTPLRNPAYMADMDPDTPTSGFHRSLVGDFTLTTDDILAGAGLARTDATPATVQAPGAASVGSTPLPLDTDVSLATPTGATLAAGTTVRVDQLQSGNAHVATLDAKTSGWVPVSGLVPRDSTAPVLRSIDGLTTLTPNHDGDADSLHLIAWFSEVVTWTAKIVDPAGGTRLSATGTADSASIYWTPFNANGPLPAGDYTLTLHGVDAWGNAPVDASTVIHVQAVPVPPTGVLVFAPTTRMTNAATVTYQLTFAAPVTGVAATDFTVTGSAPTCVVGAPTGSGASYTVPVTGCGTGALALSLEPKTVSDGTNLGPAQVIAAPSVTIDRTLPKTAAPAASLRTALTLAGSTLSTSLSWTASDSGGSGLATYDVARSLDGGTFMVVAAGLTTASWSTGMSSGHTYRFEVRASDKAGNVGAWVAGPTLYPALVQQTSTAVTWSGSWATVTSTADSGGSAKRSGTAGASATYTFGGRAVAVVVDRCATCGAVQVWLDGVLTATVDTYATSASPQWLAWSTRFSSWATHTLKLVVVGTAGRPTVDVDAFAAIK